MRAPIRVLLVVTATAVALTGCTSSVSAEPSTTSALAPSKSPRVSSAFTCGDIVSASDLAEIDAGLVLYPVGDYRIAPPSADPWSESRVSLSQGVYPPSSPAVLAAFRAGYLGCEWADAESGASLIVSAVPDGATAYAQQASINAGDDVTAYRSLGVGTKSSGGCSSTGYSGPSCRIDALVGSTWFAVMAAGKPANDASDTVRPALVRIADKMSAVLVAADGLVSARTQPDGKWDGMADCMSISTAVESVTPGMSVLRAGGLDVTGAYDPVVRAAVGSAHGFSCSGDTESSRIRISVTPGTDWLAPLNYSDGTVMQSRFSDSKALVAPRALCITSDPGTCWAEGYIDHAFVVVAGLGSAAVSADVLSAVASTVG